MGTMQRTSNACSNVFDALTDLTNKYDDVVDFMSTIKLLHQWEAALLEKSAEPQTVTDGVSNGGKAPPSRRRKAGWSSAPVGELRPLSDDDI